MWSGVRERVALPLRSTIRFVTPLSLVLTGWLLCVSLTGLGQTSGVNQGGPEYIHSPAGLDPMPQHGNSAATSKVEQMRMAERHRRVVTDAEKLVKLSNELKADIDHSPQDQLSLDMMRKAAEIEKIAHDLQGWMKS